jgi:hypothetical protein
MCLQWKSGKSFCFIELNSIIKRRKLLSSSKHCYIAPNEALKEECTCRMYPKAMYFLSVSSIWYLLPQQYLLKRFLVCWFWKVLAKNVAWHLRMKWFGQKWCHALNINLLVWSNINFHVFSNHQICWCFKDSLNCFCISWRFPRHVRIPTAFAKINHRFFFAFLLFCNCLFISVAVLKVPKKDLKAKKDLGCLFGSYVSI